MLDRKEAARTTLSISYVLPLKWTTDERRFDLTCYLALLAQICNEVLVVDGSPDNIREANATAWAGMVRHIAPDPAEYGVMGKISGVRAGVREARCEAIVIADDDVRYDSEALARVHGLLQFFDVVSPQNYFDAYPLRARWDTARTLVNRALGEDYSGTLGIRRRCLNRIGGYDGRALFDNLELIRTVRATGGRVTTVPDLYVRRWPASRRHFWQQRKRYAYEDFARPLRMILALCVLPWIGVTLVRRRAVHALAAACGMVVVADHGRRVHGGSSVFPRTSALLAPFWMVERSVFAWIALGERQRFGGLRYHGQVVFTAAHSERWLRRQHRFSRTTR